MPTFFSRLGLVLALATGPILQPQELSPRIGLNVYVTQPADTAGKVYSSGWKVNLAIHVRRESPIEGRVRLEFGEFKEGKNLVRDPYSTVRYSAQTRLVGYDWLLALGEKRETGVDFIFGIGGVHWYRERKEQYAADYPYYYNNSTTQHELAFAGTLGFRFRVSRNITFEIHHVLTSLPGSDRDFEDAELSHTAVGMGVRF